MPRGSGRRPKPTALRKLEGNRGKRAFNDQEPQPALGEPEMPKLPPEAAAEWRAIVPLLMQLGVLTAVDGKALAAYCCAFARWQQAERDIRRYGLTIREPVFIGGKKKRGLVKLKANPAIRVAHEAMKIMKSFLIEFGMTPGSRTRIATFTPQANAKNADERPANAADKYFAGPSKSIQ